MIAFWLAAALLSAGVGVLVVLRSRRAAARRETEDPSLGVYRRQLSELDDLASRGLLPESERRSARTEAARRLLAAAETAPKPFAEGGRGRLAVLLLAGGAPLVALLIYIGVGSPGVPDQPYALRLQTWQAEAKSPVTAAQLAPPEAAAVLRDYVAKHPTDPAPLVYLAHAEVDSGDTAAAERDLKRALALAPDNGQLWLLLGETIGMQAGDSGSTEAEAAFQRAMTLSPQAPEPRYFYGREQIATGDVAEGLKTWQALESDLPANHPGKGPLAQEIAAVQKTGALPPPPAQQATPDQRAMIGAMVARLAAQLQAQPDDPQGWGRLIRAYAVLGDAADQAQATARAQAEFKDRPQAWQAVQAAAQGPQ